MFYAMLYVKLFVVVLCTWITRCHAVCKPTFTVPSRQYNPGDTFLVQCSIENNNECTAIGNMIALERLHKGEWHAAIKVDSSSAIYFELEDGYKLEGRMTAIEAGGIYYFTMNDAMIDDSGDWRCGVVDIDTVYPSDTGSYFVTSSDLTKNDIILTKMDDEDVVYRYPNRYSCTSQRVYPGDLQVMWTFGEEAIVTESTPYKNGYVYRVENIRDISFIYVNETTIMCTLVKTSDLQWNVSNTLEIDANSVKAPPYTVSPISATSPTVENGLVAEYTAAGDDIAITWTINDEHLNPDYVKVTNETKYGDYEFGRTTAVKSTLTLHNIESCSDKKKVAGVYKCSVQGARKGVLATDQFPIGTECKEPIPSWGIALIVIAVLTVVVVPIVVFVFIKKKNKNKGNVE